MACGCWTGVVLVAAGEGVEATSAGMVAVGVAEPDSPQPDKCETATRESSARPVSTNGLLHPG